MSVVTQQTDRKYKRPGSVQVNQIAESNHLSIGNAKSIAIRRNLLKAIDEASIYEELKPILSEIVNNIPHYK